MLLRPVMRDPTDLHLDQAMYCRYIYMNEIEYDGRRGQRFFDILKLKKLCEQESKSLESRTHYACSPARITS